MIRDILKHCESFNRDYINLIAAECIAYPEVKEVLGCHLMDRRIEGLPEHRWYPGDAIADQVEEYTISKVTNLFSYKYANVQPYSGSLANLAVYVALLEPGDVVLSLGLKSGGHVSHGARAHYTHHLYQFHEYGLNEKEEIDFDQVRELTLAFKPKLITVGASSYYQEFKWSQFREIADLVGAFLLVDISHLSGLIVAGRHVSPKGHAHIVTFDTHKMLRGPRGGVLLWDDEALSRKINLAVSPKLQGAAFCNVIAAKAVAFEKAVLPEFSNYINNILRNTQTVAERLLAKGYQLVSGNTMNHMLSIDVGRHGHTGLALSQQFEQHGILIQRNQLPSDSKSVVETSGVKVGLPYLTCLGINAANVVRVADIIDAGIQSQWQHVDQLKQLVLSSL